MTWLVCQLAVAVMLTGRRRPFKWDQTAISLGRGSTGLGPSLRLLQGRFFVFAVRVDVLGVLFLVALPGPKTLLKKNNATPFSN